MSAAEQNDEWPGSGGEPPRHRSRWLLWLGAAVLALVILIAGSAAWVLNTERGTRWAANRAVGFLGGKLALAEVSGTLSGPLTISGIRWVDAQSGVDVRVARVTLDVALRELAARRVHVQTLDVNGVDLRLSEPTKKDEDQKPFSLQPPIDVLLDKLTLKDAHVSRDGKELFVARAAEASANWTADGVAINRFIVDSPDGNVRLTAQVSGSPADATAAGEETYNGKVSGAFRWKVADAQYVGELSATSAKQKLDAQIRLSAPFAARANASLGETKALPWQLTLEVPQFDPRKELLPGSSTSFQLTSRSARNGAESKRIAPFALNVPRLVGSISVSASSVSTGSR